MPSRAIGRNVHIYSAGDISTVLGGLVVTESMTNANFYSIVEITFILDSDYTLRRKKSGTIVQRDNGPLQAGKYLINTAGSLKVNDEPWLVRTRSVVSGAPPQVFINAVRERDHRCVITGQRALSAVYGIWTGYRVTPIFPLAHKQHWATHDLDSSITIPGSRGSIHSVQNGMLLRADVSMLFEAYDLSINPDDGYKIVSFIPGTGGIATTHIDKAFLKDPQRPTDELLRWHFRQAVLANIRGQGELDFDSRSPSSRM
ncbi:hypothetical protein B9Z19DRAFT_1073863 [Tuber borchii]|uniref:Uncharacterized protein n=1 Tax=Tuber borchii TaxID=42251 RepID=A0A2T7A5F7_TUBBO|nr:hypothetical protein B9Z19DRAFT_1073863 [Tuber borchii]